MKVMHQNVILALIVVLQSRHLIAQQPAGKVIWTYDEGATIYSSPALSLDGTVYVSVPGMLYAVTNNGTVASNKWAFPVANNHISATIGTDGTVYQLGGDGNLYSINPDGSQKWTVQVGSGGSPAIGADGTIYLQAGSSMYAITPSGTIKWQTFVGVGPNSPAIGPDGTIYAGSYDAMRLYAFKPDGTQLWFRDLPNNVGDSPAIGTDGTVYVTAGGLLAFAPDGTLLWGTSTNSFYGASPVIGYSGVLYVREFSHILTAVSPTSQVIWQSVQDNQPSAPPTVPAIDSAGTIYYCASNSLLALNSQGQVLWSVPGVSYFGVASATTSPLVGTDGIIYAALDTRLLAIASGTNGPAGSSWSMYRQNPRRTGRIERAVLKPAQKRSDANFQFELYPQQLGLSYSIQISTNLNTWTSLTSIVAATIPTDVADLTATNAPFRFYRAVSSP